MLKGLFGPNTLTAKLRGGLEEATATHRGIAQRVASALESSSATEFADELDAAQAAQRVDESDLQQDMSELADTQLRYEAEVRLLREAYDRLRTAIRGQGV